MFKPKTRVIQIRVDDELYNHFKKGADLQNMRLGEYVRWMLKPIRVLK